MLTRDNIVSIVLCLATLSMVVWNGMQNNDRTLFERVSSLEAYTKTNSEKLSDLDSKLDFLYRWAAEERANARR